MRYHGNKVCLDEQTNAADVQPENISGLSRQSGAWRRHKTVTVAQHPQHWVCDKKSQQASYIVGLVIDPSAYYQRQILMNIEKHSDDERQLRWNGQRQLRTNAGDT